MIPLHMGSLHPVEQALTLGLAFGPFVVLGIVIAVRRRRDAAEAEEAPDAEERVEDPAQRLR
ncbi:MAG TPA: hypothetical protein VNS55_07245 [Nocardioides sp.]|nr:hypothetical protein [Nocardioides sp.]